MKRVLFSAFLAALTLCLTSCPGEKIIDITPADLVGTWDVNNVYYIYKENGKVVSEGTETIPRGYRIAVTFYADGTCTADHYDDGVLEDSFPETWSLSGNTLTITETGDNMKHLIEDFDSNTLVISFTDHYVDDDGITCDDYERMTLKKVN